MVVAAFIALSTCIPIPLIAGLRYFKIMKVETNIPASVKRLNTTPSTVAMLRQNTEGSGMGDDANEYHDDDSGHNSEVENGNRTPEA